MASITFKVYKITHLRTGKCYFGSTKRTIHRRFNQHLRDYQRYISGFSSCYYSSFELFAQGKCKIELQEECDSKAEALKIEAEYIKLFECVNMVVAYRTAKEYKALRAKWRRNNKNHIRSYKAKWRFENKNHIRSYKAEWRSKNIGHIRSYNAEWRRNNKEKIKLKNSKYRAKHAKPKKRLIIKRGPKRIKKPIN